MEHEKKTGEESLVYAVLDNCSKSCFIREDIIEEMEIPVEP